MFDQGRLNNLSTMLKLNSLWKQDRARNMPKPKHVYIEHGEFYSRYMKGELIVSILA